MKLFYPRVTRWGVLLLTHLLMYATAFTQTTQTTAKGTVVNESAAPMPGVTVVVASEKTQFKRSAQTDGKGSFEFKGLDANGTYTFTFSHVGYAEKVVSGNKPDASGNITLEVKLEQSSSNTAEEVVVVGYGKSTKRDVTGAVKSVKSADFNKGIITSPEQLLQGKVAGVTVTTASGEPGAMTNITVRGPGGVRTGSTPLFVVDGIALDNSSTGGAINPLAFLNPQDIESMDVLKDASATAIYGARGANGVIIVTTKKGKAGATSLNYSFGAGLSKMARALPVFSAEEYKKQVTALGGDLDDFGGNTDWQKEITHTGFTQNHNISLSGGSNKFTYFGSFGMQLQEGVLKNNELKRYNGRMNMSQKLLEDRLVIDVNLSASNTVNARPNISTLVGSALSTNPTIPAYGPDGKPYTFESGTNPLLVLQLEKDLTTINRVLGNISGTLTILKGFTYKLNFGIDNSTGTRDIQFKPYAVPLRDGRLETYNTYNRNYLVENYLTYATVINRHKLTALAGHSYQKIFVQGRGTNINKFPINDIEPMYNPGLGQELTLVGNRPSGYATINELQSFFGRVNYQYNDKYLFTATLRADGSSKFGSNNRYGIFPSFSGAWILSKEKFLENSPFYNLKLRAGWGQTGNQEIPSKITQALYNSDNSAGASYPLYPTGAYPIGTVFVRLANPDIQWEVSNQTDLGLDFELMGGALSGTIDYFRKVSNNILVEVRAGDPIQPAPTTWTNVKGMNIINQGIEADLNYRHTTSGGFFYSIGGNITFIDNEVKNSPFTVINTGIANTAGLTEVAINGFVNGQPIGTFYLQEFLGIDANGKNIFRDVNGDGSVTADKDRVALGSALPKIMYNAYFNLGYKGFDLAANFNGVSGNKIYDLTANAIFNRTQLAKGVNTTAEALSQPKEVNSNQTEVSSRYLKDGKYIRLNNLTIGYNFNPKALGLSRWVSAMRISLTGQNLFVITPYNGYDPDVNADRASNGITSYGIDYQSYPRARSFLLGFNVTL
ncbi:SusC/RagA family TonB-linked outer membrane protein [Pseudoflavitalea sp. X16]|uniref:SusC/RagA family TonB-linked outer membrane protein n=1 Tax=Paraflavitalea devenefica TaxID=2716334 RepID=UPI0014247A67|nr:SusC/RagA family TonB-linked outer membrane protein [Paraflavitalea devenefica]NII24859.1 SusC/RagA family TonB-linked outer membrane protein [Paraflavitalea devenefica]